MNASLRGYWRVYYPCAFTGQQVATHIALTDPDFLSLHVLEQTTFDCHVCGRSHRIRSRIDAEARWIPSG